MEVIPAIDLRGGQVVRLEQGDYARESVYSARPGEVARGFCDQGAQRIHVVDLDGARDGRAGNLEALEAILRAAPSARIQTGGGIRSFEAIERRVELGADRVVLGTAALEDPELVQAAAQRFPERIVLALDARDGRVATRGWLETRGPTVEEVLADFEHLPLGALLHTDIARDGMLTGANLEATAALARQSRFPVLASGGVASIDDLVTLARTRVIEGAIVGRAIYTGAIDLAEAIEKLASC
jgi:phosphoribosylformimino-5-aminoimidazole carboxamide ribotide isomerase